MWECILAQPSRRGRQGHLEHLVLLLHGVLDGEQQVIALPHTLVIVKELLTELGLKGLLQELLGRCVPLVPVLLHILPAGLWKKGCFSRSWKCRPPGFWKSRPPVSGKLVSGFWGLSFQEIRGAAFPESEGDGIPGSGKRGSFPGMVSGKRGSFPGSGKRCSFPGMVSGKRIVFPEMHVGPAKPCTPAPTPWTW